jgi:predicted lipoprotein with Yx(FWY)xxD motif
MFAHLRFRRIVVVGLLGLAGAVACAPATTPTAPPPSPTVPQAPTAAPPTVAPTAAPTATSTAGPAAAEPVTLQMVRVDKLGSILADGKGLTLYLFTKDTRDTSNCYDQCASAWPPLVAAGQPVLQAGVDPALVGTTPRTDGTIQVTYNGWPLYYYFEDANAGDALGQATNSVWWVVSGEGNPVKDAEPEKKPTEGYDTGY